MRRAVAHAADPAQAGGLVVLPVPVARLRRLGQSAVLDAGDARAGAGARAAGPAGSRDARRRRRHRLHDGGDRRHVDPAQGDDGRPEPAPARTRAARPALAACRELLGDAEALPFGDDAFDRYVSAGSIEYWPDPQRGIAEAYRVLRARRRRRRDRPGPPGEADRPPPRRDVDAVPGERRVPRVVRARRLRRRRACATIAPDWYRGRRGAVRGRGRRAPSRARALAGGAWGGRPSELCAPLGPRERLRVAGRFVAGSLAGAAFVPIAAALTLRARLGAAARRLTLPTARPPLRLSARAGAAVRRGAVALRAPAHGDRDLAERHRAVRDRRSELPGAALGDGAGSSSPAC